MRSLFLFFSIISIFMLFSCSTQKIADEFPLGSYFYKSFNIAGELVGEGTLYISRVDSNLLEGNWSIRNTRNCFVCGPQYGSGYLTGRMENDSIYINLNPNTPQNYVELIGEIRNDSLSGDWRWFELIVNSNRGTFNAVRN